MSAAAIDLTSLDVDVRKATDVAHSIEADLAVGAPDALAVLRVRDPFGELRHTTTQATYRALADLTPSILDVPLRDGLVRWVYELLQLRIGLDLAVDESEAAHAVDVKLPARVAAERARVQREGEGSVSRSDVDFATFQEAFDAVVRAADPTKADAALSRAADLALPVAAARRERRARRFEAARRLGLAEPFALATPSSVTRVPSVLAHALLDATEPRAAAILKDAQKRSDGPWRAASAIFLGVGHDAPEGWPARPLARWLDDVWQPLVPRGVPLPPQAAPLASSSFLRAACKWGFAWKTASAPRSLPFALARDPYPTPAYRFGFALASAIAEPSFQRRFLELPSRPAAAQARVLRRTMLLHVRTHAARVILGTSEHVDAALFEEITARTFGAPMPASLRDVWPAPRVGDAAHLDALLTTRPFVDAVVARFDEDWYRNPKAGTHLTGLACAPAFEPDDPGEDAPDRASELARFFERTLG